MATNPFNDMAMSPAQSPAAQPAVDTSALQAQTQQLYAPGLQDNLSVPSTASRDGNYRQRLEVLAANLGVEGSGLVNGINEFGKKMVADWRGQPVEGKPVKGASKTAQANGVLGKMELGNRELLVRYDDLPGKMSGRMVYMVREQIDTKEQFDKMQAAGRLSKSLQASHVTDPAEQPAGAADKKAKAGAAAPAEGKFRAGRYVTEMFVVETNYQQYGDQESHVTQNLDPYFYLQGKEAADKQRNSGLALDRFGLEEDLKKQVGQRTTPDFTVDAGSAPGRGRGLLGGLKDGLQRGLQRAEQTAGTFIQAHNPGVGAAGASPDAGQVEVNLPPCEDVVPDNSRQKLGAVIGALAGAAVGKNVGDKSNTNAAIGTVAGAAVGQGIGTAADNTAAQQAQQQANAQGNCAPGQAKQRSVVNPFSQPK